MTSTGTTPVDESSFGPIKINTDHECRDGCQTCAQQAKNDESVIKNIQDGRMPSFTMRQQPMYISSINLALPGCHDSSQLAHFTDMLFCRRHIFESSKLGNEKTGRKMLVESGSDIRVALLSRAVTTFDHEYFQVDRAIANRLDPEIRILAELSEPGVQKARAHVSTESEFKAAVLTAFGAQELCTLLGLSGGSLSVSTGESSAIVAVHLADDFMQFGGCSHALVASAQLFLTSTLLAKMPAETMSTDGRTRSFDVDADGSLMSEAAVSLLLSVSNHNALATIRQTMVMDCFHKPAVFQDQRADQNMQLCVHEGNGSAVKHRDIAEIRAIDRAGSTTILGSVKSVFGQSLPVSGLLGLLKLVQTAKCDYNPAHSSTKMISAHQAAKNRIVSLILPIAAGMEIEGCPRYTVCAQGFGSSSAWAILNKHCASTSPIGIRDGPLRRDYVLPLSSHSKSSMFALVDDCRNMLKTTNLTAAQVCQQAAYLCSSHQHARYRFAVVGKSIGQMREELRFKDRLIQVISRQSTDSATFDNLQNSSALLLSPQACEYPNMSKKLSISHRSFHKKLMHNLLIASHALCMDYDELVEVIFPTSSEPIGRPSDLRYAAALTYCLEVALGDFLRECGVKFGYILGYSTGECASMVLAGFISFEDGCKLIAALSDCFRKSPGGMMLVHEDKRSSHNAVTNNMLLKLSKFCSCHSQDDSIVELAAINTENCLSLGGTEPCMATGADSLKQMGYITQAVAMNTAAHTTVLSDNLSILATAANNVEYNMAGNCKLIGSISANVVSEVNHQYFVNAIAKQVKFKQCIERFITEGVQLVTEVGPKPVLKRFVDDIAQSMSCRIDAVAVLHQNQCDWRSTLNAISYNFIFLQNISWKTLFNLDSLSVQQCIFVEPKLDATHCWPDEANVQIELDLQPKCDGLPTNIEVIESKLTEFFYQRRMYLNKSQPFTLDSFDALAIISFVKQSLAITIQFHDIFGKQSISQISELIMLNTKTTTVNGKYAFQTRTIHCGLNSSESRQLYISNIDSYAMFYQHVTVRLLMPSFHSSVIRPLLNRLVAVQTNLRSEFSISSTSAPRVTFSGTRAFFESSKNLQAQRYMLYSRFVPQIALDTEGDIDICIHHIFMDGFCLTILAKWFAQRQDKLLDMNTIHSPEMQPADIALWEQNRVVPSESRTYFLTMLETYQGIHIKEDRASNICNQYIRRSIRLNLSTGEKSGDCVDVVHYLAAYLKTVSVFVDETDILMCLPTLGIRSASMLNTIACLINMVPVRFLLCSWTTHAELRANVNTTLTDVLRHQDVPYHTIVNDCKSKLSNCNITNMHDLIFNSFITNQNTPWSKWEDGNGDKCIPYHMYSTGVNRVSLSVTLFTASLEVNTRRVLCDYNAGSFYPETVVGLLLNFSLNSVWPSYPTLAQGELRQDNGIIDKACNEIMKSKMWDIGTFGNTCRSDKCQIERMKYYMRDKANSCMTQQTAALQRADLSAKQELISRYICRWNASNCGNTNKSDEIVSVSIQRNIDAICLIASVHMSGCSSSFIDPEYPDVRRTYLLRTLNSSVNLVNLPYISLRSTVPSKQRTWNSNSIRPTNVPMDLAYIIFTSGSTGEPKGVCIPINTLVSTVESATRRYKHPNVHTLYFQTTSFLFDQCVFDFCLCALHGCRMIVSMESVTSVSEVGISKPTYSYFVTTLLSNCSANQLKPLRDAEIVVVGGDILQKTTIQHAQRLNILLWNQYGPTETVVCSTATLVTCASRQQSIGHNLDGEAVFILDSQYRHTSTLGCPGQIFIGGVSVSRGYLKQASQTATKFVEQNQLPEARYKCLNVNFYATGDQAKWRCDGHILFEGRQDFQVKVRGYRIELGEIENALNCLGYVGSTVIAIGDIDKQLIAFVVDVNQIGLGDTELKQWLKETLPVYMVPQTILTLPNIPLTLTGKIDRQSLTHLFLSRQENTTEADTVIFSQSELMVINLWESVLGSRLTPSSTAVNLFEVGGSSLTVLRLTNEYWEQLGLKLTIRELFYNTTIKQQATLIDSTKFNKGSVRSSTNIIERQLQTLPINCNIIDEAPLTLIQQQCWFMQLLDKSLASYVNHGVANIMHGTFNCHAINQAFNRVVARQTILRTRQRRQEGGAFSQYQLSTSNAHYVLKNERKIIMASEQHWEFDLELKPPVRVHISLRRGELMFLTNMQHSITEGCTTQLLLRGLGTIYNQVISNGTVVHQPLAINYLEYAYWYNSVYQCSKELSDQVDFWRANLSGYNDTEIPTDKARTLLTTYSRSSIFSMQPTAAKIQMICTQLNLSDYCIQFASMSLAITKLTCQEDIVIGCPINARLWPKTEQIMGCFMNMLAIRASIGQNTTRAYLLHVRDTVRIAFEHQNAPFLKVVASVQLFQETSLYKTPIYQILLNQSPAGKIQRLLNKEISNKEIVSSGTSLVDVGCSYEIQGERFVFELWDFNSNIFHIETILKFLALKCHMLSTLGECIERDTLSGISKSSSGRNGQLHRDQSSTAVRTSANHLCVSSIIHAQLSLTRSACSVFCKESIKPTAYQVSRAINVGAAKLKQLQPTEVCCASIVDSPFCLLCAAKPDLIMLILSVISAGHQFIPLDCRYPKQRIDYICADTSGYLLEVTTRHSTSHCTVHNEPLKSQSHNVLQPALPFDIFYTIYTSGSTGLPKGVPIVNYSLCVTLQGIFSRFPILTAGMHMYQTYNFVFDVGLLDIWHAVMSGALMDLKKGFEMNIGSVGSMKIEFVNLPTSVFCGFSKKQFRQMNSAERVMICGEKFRGHCYEPVVSLGLPVLNMYGPTETTICSTGIYLKQSQSPHLIGKSLAGETAHVLSDSFKVCPIGAFGTLFISGDSLTRGYIKRIEETTSIFSSSINSGFGVGASLLYNTGDIVKLNKCGNISFSGRRDFQLKIHGYRVELQEIEKQLSWADAGFDEFYVLPVCNAGRYLIVVVYVAKRELNSNQLSITLANTLPEYMVPTQYVKADLMPRTLSGKIDRKALIDVVISQQCRKNNSEGTRDNVNYLQAKIRLLWDQTLPKIGSSANSTFFERGGSSITMFNLQYLYVKEFGVKLRISDVLKYNTVTKMAQYLSSVLGIGNPTTVLDNQTACVKTSNSLHQDILGCNLIPLSKSQQDLLFLKMSNRNLEDMNHNSFCMLSVILHGLKCIPHLNIAVNVGFAQHSILRSVVFSEYNEAIGQAVDSKTTTVIRIHCSFLSTEIILNDIISSSPNRPAAFGLAFLPSEFCQLSNSGLALTMAIEHTFVDDYSMGYLTRSVLSIYEKLSNQEVYINYSQDQFMKYVYWELDALQSSSTHVALKYWSRQLSSFTCNYVPGDMHNATLIQGRQIVCFQTRQSHCFELANKLNSTIFSLWLSCLASSIITITCNPSISIACPTDMRMALNLTGVVGCLTSMFVIYSTLRPSLNFVGLVRTIHKLVTEALTHSQVAFSVVLDAIRHSNQPLTNYTQYMFNFLEHSKATQLSPGFLLSRRNLMGIGTVQSDILLTILKASNPSTEQGVALMGSIDFKNCMFSSGSMVRFIQRILTSEQKLHISVRQETVYICNSVEWMQSKCIKPCTQMVDVGSRNVFRLHQMQFQSGNARLWNSSAIRATNLLKQIHNHRCCSISPDTFICICSFKTMEFYALISVIMDAGLAYIPVDANYPDIRKRFIQGDVGPAFQISLDNESEYLHTLVEEREASFSERATISEVCYVLYTSGTTGQPKGVCITYDALNIFCYTATINIKCLNPGYKLYQLYNHAFDGSLCDLALAMSNGCSLIIPQGHHSLDFQNDMISKRTSVANLPASILRQSKLSESNRFWTLTECLTSGGESPEPAVLNHAVKMGQTLFNFYGPTETTIVCYIHRVDAYSCHRNATIGKPLRACMPAILDNSLKPVICGATGMLFIAGPIVSRGYINAAATSLSKFAEISIQDQCVRAYNTGDLVKQSIDGDVIYKGRADNQVKVYGFRVDLTEIERNLQAIYNVRESIVLQHNGALVAVVWMTQPSHTPEDAVAAIRGYACTTMPQYMQPSRIITVEEFPVNLHGKIDREALLSKISQSTKADVECPTHNFVHRERVESHVANIERHAFSDLADVGDSSTKWHTDMYDKVILIWKTILNCSSIDTEKNFFQHGGSSILALRLQQKYKQEFGVDVAIADVFTNSTVASATAFFNRAYAKRYSASKIASHRGAKSRTSSFVSTQRIAVISITGQFSGSSTIDEFWKHIVQGRDCITRRPNTESRKENSMYVAAVGKLQNTMTFDYPFWGLSKADASLMSPLIRKYLECCWHTLEHSPYLMRRAKQSIGTFSGCGYNFHYEAFLQQGKSSVELWQAGILNDLHAVSSNVSYRLGLLGPAVGLNTACSTGLAVIVEACSQIQNGTCQLALAGSVSFCDPKIDGYEYLENMILSKDGYCRVFDENASGTVIGAGCASVLLCSDTYARENGDRILATIAGFGLNNDGSMKMGYTAPSMQGQCECIKMALNRSNITAEAVSYVECHGTGTKIGDPIEFDALSRALTNGRKRIGPCIIGAVKANIGHADAAAGLAGFSKVCQMLQHHQIPRLIHFNKLNHLISPNVSTLTVSTETIDWAISSSKRIAGISSFGIGGTNVHVLIKESDLKSITENKGRVTLSNTVHLTLSGKSPSSCLRNVHAVASFLQRNPTYSLALVGMELAFARESFKHRYSIAADSMKSAIVQLQACQKKDIVTASHPDTIVFQFAGQGRDIHKLHYLLQRNSVPIDKWLHTMSQISGVNAFQILMDAADGMPGFFNVHHSALLQQTEWAQPLHTLLSVLLGKTLNESHGINQDVCSGHSIGLLSASVMLGQLSISSMLKLAYHRGRLMQTLMPSGRMIATTCAAVEQVKCHFDHDNPAISAVNDGNNIVLGGGSAQMSVVTDFLLKRRLGHHTLDVGKAFHTDATFPAMYPYKEYLFTGCVKEPTVRCSSNISDHFATNKEATNIDYWVALAVSTVQYKTAVKVILDECKNAVWIEIGIGSMLNRLVSNITLGSANTISCTSHGSNSELNLHTVTAKLWMHGNFVNWDKLQNTNLASHKYVLPFYQFAEIECSLATVEKSTVPSIEASSVQFYLAIWRKLPGNTIEFKELQREFWIIFRCKQLSTKNIKKSISNHFIVDYYNHNCECLIGVEADSVPINALYSDSYSTIKELIGGYGKAPTHILHTWLLTGFEDEIASEEQIRYVQLMGAYSIAWIQHYILAKVMTEVKLIVLASQLASEVSPAKSTVLGHILEIPVEMPWIQTVAIDVGASEVQLTGEIFQSIKDISRQPVNLFARLNGSAVMLVNGTIWKQIMVNVNIAPSHTDKIYQNLMIIGGFSAIGLAIAKSLLSKRRVEAVVDLVVRDKTPMVSCSEKANRQTLCDINEMQASITTNIAIHSCDITNSSCVSKLLETVGGKMELLIHAAGVPPMRKQAHAFKSMERVSDPKVYGTWNLLQQIQKHQILVDQFVLLSSISTDLPTPLYGDYASANCYLDALESLTAKVATIKHTKIINLPGWQNGGMGQKMLHHWDAPNRNSDTDQANAFTIGEREGVDAIMRAISQHVHTRLAISKSDLCLEKMARYEQGAKHQDLQGGDVCNTSIIVELQALLKTALGEIHVDETENFTNLGVNSLNSIQITNQIFRQFNVKLEQNDMLVYNTIALLACRLTAVHNPTNKILIPLAQSECDRNVFLIHGAGGGLHQLAELGTNLSKSAIKCFGLQMPDLSHRAIQPNLVQLASEYANTIQTVQSTDPLVLFGYSFGGTMAVEIARQMLALGSISKAIVVLFDTWANFESQFPDEATLRTSVRNQIQRNLITEYGIDESAASQLPFLNDVIETFIVSTKLLTNHQAIVSADCTTYLLKAATADNLHGNMMKQKTNNESDPSSNHWQPISKKTIHVETVAGCHQTMLRSMNNEALRVFLETLLAEIGSDCCD